MWFLTIELPQEIKKEICSGNIKNALRILIRRLKNTYDDAFKSRLIYEIERLKRIKKVFPYSYKSAFKKASLYIKGLTIKEFNALVSEDIAEWILIDGKKRFEKRFFYNIVYRDPSYKSRVKEDLLRKKAKEYLDVRIRQLISGSDFCDYKVKIKFSLYPDINGKVRVWIPVAKNGFQIKDVRIIEAGPKPSYIPNKNYTQQSIYFYGDGRNEYYVLYEFRVSEWVCGRFRFKDNKKNLSYYLSEMPPHIVFSKNLIELVKRIVGNEKTSFKKASKIYDWITENIKYSFVKPYMFYDNIPQWVFSNMRGDCGFQSLFFITLARIAGVPARWQSGWYINPYYQGPHDWALFYDYDLGWLPCDLSFGGARRDDECLRMFYFSNLDGFRVVFNDDFMSDLYPPKRFFRTDPYDNQVGEVETKERNIYDFKYKFEIIDFKEVLYE